MHQDGKNKNLKKLEKSIGFFCNYTYKSQSKGLYFFHEEICQGMCINDRLFSIVYIQSIEKSVVIKLPPQVVKDLEVKIVFTGTGS